MCGQKIPQTVAQKKGYSRIRNVCRGGGGSGLRGYGEEEEAKEEEEEEEEEEEYLKAGGIGRRAAEQGSQLER